MVATPSSAMEITEEEYLQWRAVAVAVPTAAIRNGEHRDHCWTTMVAAVADSGDQVVVAAVGGVDNN